MHSNIDHTVSYLPILGLDYLNYFELSRKVNLQYCLIFFIEEVISNPLAADSTFTK